MAHSSTLRTVSWRLLSYLHQFAFLWLLEEAYLGGYLVCALSLVFHAILLFYTKISC